MNERELEMLKNSINHSIEMSKITIKSANKYQKVKILSHICAYLNVLKMIDDITKR